MKKKYIQPSVKIVSPPWLCQGGGMPDNSNDGYKYGNEPIDAGGAEGKENDWDDDWNIWNSSARNWD